MGEIGSSVVNEFFLRSVDDAAPWSFLTLNFFKLSGGMRRFSLV